MKNLTRRDFIRLCGTSSIGLALAACGVSPTPTATPAPTNTTLPTSTPLPTATLTNTPAPTSTAVATATATLTPRPPTMRQYAEAIGFEMGVAVGRHDRRQLDIYGSQFGMVSIASDLEWNRLEPVQGNLIFASSSNPNADGWTDFASINNMVTMSSPLIAWQKYPGWLKEACSSPDAARKLLIQHIVNVVAHYKGKINKWIVVNDLIFAQIGLHFIERRDSAFQIRNEGYRARWSNE